MPEYTYQHHHIVYGCRRINFELSFVERVRVAIRVNPDLSVHVHAPLFASTEEVVQVVKRKARWILKQKRYFQQFLPRTPQRQYVSGESHLYLGRRYRLKISKASAKEDIKLRRGFFCIWVTGKDPSDEARRLLAGWYRNKARHVFHERLKVCIRHHIFRDIDFPRLEVRRMAKRWGSFTTNWRLVLNLELIRAPKSCIDYVITHELCHALVQNHSRAFHQKLERALPDWQKDKHALECLLA